MVAPFRWSCAALLVLGCDDAYQRIVVTDPSFAEALNFTSAAATFCPMMAVLGAKRPQNVGWQLIVLTLWAVLTLPVAEMLVLWQGGTLDLGPAREWMLIILIVVGLANYVLTRFGAASCLFAIGQSFVLWRHLPLPDSLNAIPNPRSIGTMLIVVAVFVVWFQTRTQSTSSNWDQVWGQFRDMFGLVWGLRVMERVNSTGKIGDWKTELQWTGFQPSTGWDPEEAEAIEKTMRTLLRRFLSTEWIDARLKS